MALSNIGREPRREITESLVGTVVLAGLLVIDYFGAVFFHEITGGDHGGCPVPLGMLFFVPAGMLIVIGVGVYFAHFLGEVACGLLAKFGLELRPKERYR